MSELRWRDLLNAVIGLWLVQSPLVLDFTKEGYALATAVAIGVALVLLATTTTALPGDWHELSIVVLGFCLVASPIGFDYSTHTAASANAVFAGAAMIGLAVWALLTDSVDSNHHQGHPPQPR
jgi:SPW repeat